MDGSPGALAVACLNEKVAGLVFATAEVTAAPEEKMLLPVPFPDAPKPAHSKPFEDPRILIQWIQVDANFKIAS